MKQLSFLIMLLSIILPCSAQEVIYDGLKYTKNDYTETCTLTGYETAPSGDLIIPSSVYINGTSYQVAVIGENALNSITGLTSVEIPNSVTEIQSWAFSDCRGLTRVKIPSSVKTIKYDAFDNCINLNIVDISDLAAWCRIVFYNEYSNPFRYAKHLYLDGQEVIGELNIPEGPTRIQSYAFYSLEKITKVTIPNTVTSIGRYAFYNCKGLTDIKLSEFLKTIESKAFTGCSNVSYLKIPKSLTTVELQAFMSCNIKTVEIEDLVSWCNIKFENDQSNPLSKLGGLNYTTWSDLYLNEEKITKLVIPDEVTSISDFAFNYCTSISSIEIANSVTSIGKYAFYDCLNLKTIELPNSITEINDQAFATNSAIDVKCLAETPPSLNGDVFSNKKGTLFVPKNSIELYKNAIEWKDFKILSLEDYEIKGKIVVDNFKVDRGGLSYCGLNLELSRSVTYSGFQFDVEMPDGLSISEVKLGDALTSAGFVLKNSEITGNPTRIVAYQEGSNAGNGSTITNGILTLTVKANENASEGEKQIKFTNGSLSTPTGSDIYLEDSETTVTVKGIPVSGIEVKYSSGKNGNLYVDETVVYTAVITPENATDKGVTWSIVDPTVASITANNSQVTVKALKIGETTLKATAKDGSGVAGTATIKVVATPISRVTISSQDNKTSIYPDDILVLTATVNPTTATAPVTYAWKSETPAVATVTGSTPTVNLTAIKTGSTNITVTATNAAGNVTSEKFTVTVIQRPITSVTLSEKGPFTLDLYENKEKTITATVNPSNATNPVVTWKSDKPEIATVDNGKITAVSLGTATITVTASNAAGQQSISFQVNVVATPAKQITISGGKSNLKVTEELQLTAKVWPEETTYPEVDWTSSDDTKASVDNSGKVIAKAAGQVTITATVKATPEVNATYNITITDFLLGDANDNGEVTVADVVTIANHIVEAPVDNINEINADVTRDGYIRTDDVTATVNILLGNVSVNKLNTRATMSAADSRLIVNEKKEGSFGRTLTIHLEGAENFTSIQADIVLPSGTSLASLAKGLQAENHTWSYNLTAANVLKVIVYSFDNELLSGNGNLLEVELENVLQGESVEVKNIYASDSDATLYSIGSENNEVAGISGIYGDEDGLFRVYSIQGFLILSTYDASEIENLDSGIYIINGKKVMINK